MKAYVLPKAYIIYPGNSHFIGFIRNYVFCILFYQEFQTVWNEHLLTPLSTIPSEKL